MKSALLKFAFLFIATSCICGMCSKDDATDNTDNNNLIEPDLRPDATWLYFDDTQSLVYFYPDNKRPRSEKWVATKINAALSAVSIYTNKRTLSWEFENSGDTRFLSNSLNSGGKESFEVFINEIAAAPGAGSYTMDGDFKNGFCWYNVYTSSGALHDSTRHQEFLTSSTLNITKISFVQSLATNVDRYKMTGNAVFHIMYWQNGTSSTTDIHTLNCTFNNVPIDFYK